MGRLWRDWYSVESERFISTDVLRFFASAGIVAYHYLAHVANVDAYGEPLRRVYYTLNLFVEVFFVVSGYVIYSVYADRLGDGKGYRQFVRARIARLVPLHYATLVFYLIILVASLAIGMEVGKQYDLSCLPAQLTLTQAWGFCPVQSFNVPSWSISAEMAVYLAAPLLFIAGRSTLVTWAVIGGSLFFGYYVAERHGWPLLHQRSDQMGFLRALPAFLFGVWLAQRPTASWLKPFARLPLVPVFLVYLILPAVVDSPAARLMLAYAMALVAFARDSQGVPSPTLRRLAPLGRLSYSLYMLHSPLATLFVTLLLERVLHVTGVGKAVAVAAIALILLPIVSILSLTLFELPARRWIAGRRRDQSRIAVEIAP